MTPALTPQLFSIADARLEDGWAAPFVSPRKLDTRIYCGIYWTEPGERSAFSFERVDAQEPGVAYWGGEMDDIYLVLAGSLMIDYAREGKSCGSLKMATMEVAYLPRGYTYYVTCTSEERTLVFTAAAPPPRNHPTLGEARQRMSELAQRTDGVSQER